MNILHRFWAWLRSVFARETAPLRSVAVEDVPEKPRNGKVYLVGENGHFWCAVLKCPCTCGAVIQLNLVSGTRPVWSFELEDDTQCITLRPSVWRTAGCRSHFFLRAGRVVWCEEASPRR